MEHGLNWLSSAKVSNNFFFPFLLKVRFDKNEFKPFKMASSMLPSRGQIAALRIMEEKCLERNKLKIFFNRSFNMLVSGGLINEWMETKCGQLFFVHHFSLKSLQRKTPQIFSGLFIWFPPEKSCGNAGDLPNGQFEYEGNSYLGEKVYAVCNLGWVKWYLKILGGIRFWTCYSLVLTDTPWRGPTTWSARSLAGWASFPPVKVRINPRLRTFQVNTPWWRWLTEYRHLLTLLLIFGDFDEHWNVLGLI